MAEGGEVFSCQSIDEWKEHIDREKISEKLEVAKEYEVEAMPTFIFMKQGQVIDRIVGAKKDELMSKTESYAHA